MKKLKKTYEKLKDKKPDEYPKEYKDILRLFSDKIAKELIDGFESYYRCGSVYLTEKGQISSSVKDNVKKVLLYQTNDNWLETIDLVLWCECIEDMTFLDNEIWMSTVDFKDKDTLEEYGIDFWEVCREYFSIIIEREGNDDI
jgi:hypothetical protein